MSDDCNGCENCEDKTETEQEEERVTTTTEVTVSLGMMGSDGMVQVTHETDIDENETEEVREMLTEAVLQAKFLQDDSEDEVEDWVRKQIQ